MPPKLICPPPNGLPAGYRPAPPDPWPGRLLLPGAHGRHPRASQAPVGCPPPDASFFLLINSAAPIGKSVTMRGAAEGRASATAFFFFLQKQWELCPGTAARLIRIPACRAIRHIWWLCSYSYMPTCLQYLPAAKKTPTPRHRPLGSAASWHSTAQPLTLKQRTSYNIRRRPLQADSPRGRACVLTGSEPRQRRHSK